MKLPARVGQWGEQFLAAGMSYGLDPALLAAICDRESLGGLALSPPGPGGLGDEGHGHGLMQIDDRSHGDFIRLSAAGGPAWADPALNIMEGARILKGYLDEFGGEVPAGICAYNAGPGGVRRAKASLMPYASPADVIAAYDAHTTGHNYVSDVLDRMRTFTGEPEGTT